MVELSCQQVSVLLFDLLSHVRRPGGNWINCSAMRSGLPSVDQTNKYPVPIFRLVENLFHGPGYNGLAIARSPRR